MVKIDTKHKLNSALIGIILFDGSMPANHCLYIRHGGNQLGYVDEKVNFISKYYTPKSIRTSIDKAGYTYRYAYYNNYNLNFLYKNIYKKDKKKTLAQNILNRFDEITLAIMYMDDGCLGLHKDLKHEGVYKSREIHLNVQSFSFDEVKRLQNLLLKKWGLEFHLTTDKNKPRLWCNTKNTIKFLEIVAPVIIDNFPSMYYKLDLKYKNKKINFLPE